MKFCLFCCYKTSFLCWDCDVFICGNFKFIVTLLERLTFFLLATGPGFQGSSFDVTICHELTNQKMLPGIQILLHKDSYCFHDNSVGMGYSKPVTKA